MPFSNSAKRPSDWTLYDLKLWLDDYRDISETFDEDTLDSSYIHHYESDRKRPATLYLITLQSSWGPLKGSSITQEQFWHHLHSLPDDFLKTTLMTEYEYFDFQQLSWKISLS